MSALPAGLVVLGSFYSHADRESDGGRRLVVRGPGGLDAWSVNPATRQYTRRGGLGSSPDLHEAIAYSYGRTAAATFVPTCRRRQA